MRKTITQKKYGSPLFFYHRNNIVFHPTKLFNDNILWQKQADQLFNSLGINMTTAFNVFFRQSVREGRIPFEISLNYPNRETITSMLETERIASVPNVQGYNSLEELMRALDE